MRFAIALLALCGCNQIFGLDKTIAVGNIDARYFDAPIDAPFSCPSIGQTPQFSRLFHQLPQNCSEYSASISTGQATAMCFDPRMQIAHGMIDGPLDLIAGFEIVNKLHYDVPRVTPEGDEVMLRVWNESMVVGRFAMYRITGDTLTYEYDVTLPNSQTIDSFARYGAPSRGPRRRMLVRNTGTSELEEIDFDTTGASTHIAFYPPASLGLTAIAGLPPSLTGDGLRMVIYAGGTMGSGLYYAQRASVDVAFSTATLLDDVPATGDAFMTDDCERIYFSALGSVLWVQQI